VDCGDGLVYPLLDGLTDLTYHQAQMDEQGIGVRLVSPPPPGVAGLTKADSVAVARDANDELAELSTRSGGRLRGLALLPLQHPEDAADELCRAAALGLPGAQLLSNAAGGPLDGAEYHALFAAAAECDIPLVLHPTLPIDRSAVDAHGLLTTLGFLFDTTACAARLVLSGLYDRHPHVKVLLPHAGSTIPYLLGRFDYELELMGIDPDLSGRPSEHLRQLYLDCVCESPQNCAARCRHLRRGPGHVRKRRAVLVRRARRPDPRRCSSRRTRCRAHPVPHGSADLRPPVTRRNGCRSPRWC
jgi:predicted TIM-barrel fold metal-dependent hydrolase